MNERRKQMRGKRILGLAPAVAALAFVIFAGCDPGDAPDPPTGPASTYDPLFDEARPGVTARVRPSTVLTPDPVTGNEAVVSLIGVYRDPNGNPQAGLQMNFTADPSQGTSLSFDPPAAFTNSDGLASTEVTVSTDLAAGSYTLVAYTSPASGGPNARGQTQLVVNLGEIVSTPNPPSGSANVADQNPLVGVSTDPTNYVLSGSTSSLGNPVEYRIDCGTGFGPLLGAGVTTGTCDFDAAGTFLVRAVAVSSTGVTSDPSAPLTVTVTDTVP